MVMADVTVLTDMWKEEEKRIKELLEKLGQQMKDHGVGPHVVGAQRNFGWMLGKGVLPMVLVWTHLNNS